MTNIAQNLKSVLSDLPEGVRLVAVSKFHPVEALKAAYDAGQRIFGESRAQELVAKVPQMPNDVEWHFIGHLQENKVRLVVPSVSLIHSVDSARLLACINRHAEQCGRTVPCLLQVHVAQEETKFGFTPAELLAFLKAGEWRNLKNVRISGLMCMATNTDDASIVRNDFHTADALFREAQQTFFPDAPYFSIRSWGMSGDYRLALEEGSNMVRVGTRIFGERQY